MFAMLVRNFKGKIPKKKKKRRLTIENNLNT